MCLLITREYEWSINMPHIFNVEDSIAFNSLVWTELKKHGIKETGRWRKPTRNNVLVFINVSHNRQIRLTFNVCFLGSTEKDSILPAFRTAWKWTSSDHGGIWSAKYYRWFWSYLCQRRYSGPSSSFCCTILSGHLERCSNWRAV